MARFGSAAVCSNECRPASHGIPSCHPFRAGKQLADRIETHFSKHGFGLYAAELRSESRFIGYVGFNIPTFQAAFTPCVEIGWRLAAEYWGQGLATEAAREIVRYGFTELGLDELVSFTVPSNVRSIRVMEKVGMSRDPNGDFDHPQLPAGHRLRRHVLYRLSRSAHRRMLGEHSISD